MLQIVFQIQAQLKHHVRHSPISYLLRPEGADKGLLGSCVLKRMISRGKRKIDLGPGDGKSLMRGWPKLSFFLSLFFLWKKVPYWSLLATSQAAFSSFGWQGWGDSQSVPH